MKNIVIVILAAVIVVLFVALYYEKKQSSQTSSERDTVLDIVKSSTETSKELLVKTSKASADILRGIKDKVESAFDKASLDEENLLKVKDDFQGVLNEVQSDVETQIDTITLES